MTRNWDERERELEFIRQELSEMAYEDAQAKQRQAQPRAKQADLPPLVVRPGSHWAAAAFKAGREDEWINAMQARYGDLYD